MELLIGFVLGAVLGWRFGPQVVAWFNAMMK